GDHNERCVLPRLQHQPVHIADGLDPISEVLHAVYQLAAREQILVENQRQRCRHGSSLVQSLSNCKKLPARVSVPARFPHPPFAIASAADAENHPKLKLRLDWLFGYGTAPRMLKK